MAQDSEVPKAADKGKGKAVDDAKKDKQQENGKKEDDKIESMRPSHVGRHVMLTNALAAEEELSEEDQQLKNELDMMVERLTVSFSMWIRERMR